MASHRMPPARFSLDRPWKFSGWDNSKDFIPPWEYRHFWYTSGDGDYVIVSWQHAFDEGGFYCVSGHIYRATNLLAAFRIFRGLRSMVEQKAYAGAFIFYGRSRMSAAQCGESFPEHLPDGRW
jgi:hypothetical protein